MVVWGGGQAVTIISDKSVNPLPLCTLLEENCRNMFHVTVIELFVIWLYEKPFVYKNRNNFLKNLHFFYFKRLFQTSLHCALRMWFLLFSVLGFLSASFSSAVLPQGQSVSLCPTSSQWERFCPWSDTAFLILPGCKRVGGCNWRRAPLTKVLRMSSLVTELPLLWMGEHFIFDAFYSFKSCLSSHTSVLLGCIY